MFEETLVCDGCSRVIDGGDRETTLRTLRDGGRAFFRDREAKADEPWGSTRRHLCANCVGATVFFDGEPVPEPCE